MINIDVRNQLMITIETAHTDGGLAPPGGSSPALTPLFFLLFLMGFLSGLNEKPSAPDSRLIYGNFCEHWSVVANINKQVISKQSYQLFPQKDENHVQGSFSHLFLVFAIKIELFVKWKSCFELDLGQTLGLNLSV